MWIENGGQGSDEGVQNSFRFFLVLVGEVALKSVTSARLEAFLALNGIVLECSFRLGRVDCFFAI